MVNSDLSALRANGLLPFQAHFVLEFLARGSAPVWEFASPTGTGKVYLSTEIVRRILDTQLDARVLILTPAALTMQWSDRLASRGVHALVVDRSRFIELVASTPPERPIWPRPAVTVMSLDFAKRSDVQAALNQVEWDLVLADESHLLAGKRADVFFDLLSSGRARRGLMLTSLPTTREYPGLFAFSRRTVALRDIVDWDNRPMFEPMKPPLEVITYSRSAEEVNLLRGLEELAAHVARLSPALQFHADWLVRAAASSPYAAQRVGWSLRNRLSHARNLVAHGRPVELTALTTLEAELDGEPLDESLAEPSPVSAEALRAFFSHGSTLDAILARLDDLPGDSKLELLKAFLESSRNDTAPTRVCVWIQFQATAQYLIASLEGLGVEVFRLQAATPSLNRMATVHRFKETGGVLIATGTAVEGLDLAFTEQCIHYDLPANQGALDQRIGRFLRLGRANPFRSIALRDSRATLSWEERVFADLERPPGLA